MISESLDVSDSLRTTSWLCFHHIIWCCGKELTSPYLLFLNENTCFLAVTITVEINVSKMAQTQENYISYSHTIVYSWSLVTHHKEVWDLGFFTCDSTIFHRRLLDLHYLSIINLTVEATVRPVTHRDICKSVHKMIDNSFAHIPLHDKQYVNSHIYLQSKLGYIIYGCMTRGMRVWLIAVPVTLTLLISYYSIYSI